MKKLIAATVLLLFFPALAMAQKTGPQHTWQGYAFLGAGTGARYCGATNCTIWHGGFGAEGFLYKGLGAGAEAGYAQWGPYYDTQAFITSGDFSYHFRRRAARGQIDPFTVLGITGYFPVSRGRGSAAGNFGGGVNIWLLKRAALRLEIRDYVNLGHGQWPARRHSVSFRFGITFR